MTLSRRSFACLSIGTLLNASLLGVPALAQQPQGQLTPQAGLPARPAPQPMQVSVQMEKVLQAWEQKSANIKTLQGVHERFVYQPSVGIEKRARGSYFFKAPDQGRIDIEPVEITKDSPSVAVGKGGEMLNTSKVGMDGKPLRVISAEKETWVADGAQVLGLNESLGEKIYSRVEIPVQMRGDNVADGPLPFLFGVSADKMKARYRLQFGGLNNLDSSKGPVQIHVVAFPTRQVDARNWQRAEVILEPRWFFPKAIMLKDGTDASATETVYVFDHGNGKMFANQKWQATGLRRFFPGFDPFKPDLRGYKLLEDHRVGQVDARMQGK